MMSLKPVNPENIIVGDSIRVSNKRGKGGVSATYRGTVHNIIRRVNGNVRFETREGGLIFQWKFGSRYPGTIHLLKAAVVNPEPLFDVYYDG